MPLWSVDPTGEVARVFETQSDRVIELAADERSLFWAQDGCSKGPHRGSISRLNHGTNRGDVIVTQAGWCVVGMATAGPYLYWLTFNDTAIRRVLKTGGNGGNVETVWEAEELGFSPGKLALADGSAYFVLASRSGTSSSAASEQIDRLVRVHLANGSIEEIEREPKSIREVATDDTAVFWTVAEFGSHRGVIRVLRDGRVSTLVELTHEPTSLRVASGFLWWLNASKDPDALMRVSTNGGTPELIESARDDKSDSLVLVGPFVYWSTNDWKGRLWRARFD